MKPRIRQQRRRSIQMGPGDLYTRNHVYTWIPFEHCVCVWKKVTRPGVRHLVDAELPAQFARHGDEPVLLSDVAHFIKRVFLAEQAPMAERKIILLTQEPGPMQKRSWSPIDIIGSFEDAELAQQEAEQRTIKSNICVYRALTLDLYAQP